MVPGEKAPASICCAHVCRAFSCVGQHGSAWVSMGQHGSASTVRICAERFLNKVEGCAGANKKASPLGRY